MNEKITPSGVQLKIDKNRDKIDRLLSAGLPPNVLYHLVYMLSKSNEKLIKQLNS